MTKSVSELLPHEVPLPEDDNELREDPAHAGPDGRGTPEQPTVSEGEQSEHVQRIEVEADADSVNSTDENDALATDRPTLGVEPVAPPDASGRVDEEGGPDTSIPHEVDDLQRSHTLVVNENSTLR